MKEKMDSLELKKVQIQILDVVKDFCNNNNIKFWLDSGTLLGAIRHKGYIPWDDDIDIGMMREDFDKFMKLFNKKNDRYKFYCIENKDDFYFPFGKVLDTKTILYEPNEKYGVKLSVNIDVFVYDNAPNDFKEIKKMFKKRDLYNFLSYVQLYRHELNKDNFIKSLIKIPIHLLLKAFPKGYFCQKVVHNSKKYTNIEAKKIGNFTSVTPAIGDKEWFSSFIEVEFEGKKYPAPVGYDKWLKTFYGDYMKLPPKEKQVTHHSFVAYMCDSKEN